MDPLAIIGYILIGMLTLQPALGYIHQLIFKSRFLAVQAGEPNAKARGRILIPLGIINRALGIKAT